VKIGLKDSQKGEMKNVATLVMLKFDTPDGAEKSLDLAERLQKQQLLQIDDAATVTWPKGNKRPKTRQIMHLGTLGGALDGAFWGMLLGFIFFVPLFGLTLGAAIGGLSGHLGYCGVDDDFIKQVRTKVTEGTSGLFLLLETVTTDKVLEAFQSAPHFQIIMTNLTHEQEQKLREVFA
jgi:uncharacterized membrane protein